MKTLFLEKIAQQLSIPSWKVEKVIHLSNEGGTIPFIARYRKDQTGNLDEVQIASVLTQFQSLTDLAQRKETIRKAIIEQEKLTDELKAKIDKCWDEKELEDIYLPYKKRRKTKADVAIENGLAPLAKILMAQRGNTTLDSIATRFTNETILTPENAVEGAKHIAAQWISERINIRHRLRKLFWQKGIVISKVIKTKQEEAEKYTDYFDFSEPVSRIKSHRFLAITRGANEGLLKMKIEPPLSDAIELITSSVLISNGDFQSEMIEAIADSYKRLLKPSLENEIRTELKSKADAEAIRVFTANLRQLLLQPPLGAKRILALDPGFRSGCKAVCLDDNGNLLHNETIYPHPPQKEVGLAKKKISTWVEQYQIEAIAIGNGTASRETERLVKGIHFDRTVQVFVVNEAGASIYSASKVAREEFPQYDVTVRGAVSIGRRLMDPLAELVKIDPKSIGVGQYQHDVDQKQLQQQLDDTVISCVNTVGVDLTTASKYLLRYVSGIGPVLAENIVTYRDEMGGFTNRKELSKVTKLGAKAFEQCAGFLRIPDGDQLLDNSSVHPESYPLVERMVQSIGDDLNEVIGNEEKVKAIPIDRFITNEVGEATLSDIINELKKPGRDPRRAAKVFEFSKEIRSIEDLKEGMELPGIVNNVTNFGAFVDIGIKENGLIHISNLANEFISDPAEIINLHEHVKVHVLSIDKVRKRIGLKRIE